MSRIEGWLLRLARPREVGWSWTCLWPTAIPGESQLFRLNITVSPGTLLLLPFLTALATATFFRAKRSQGLPLSLPPSLSSFFSQECTHPEVTTPLAQPVVSKRSTLKSSAQQCMAVNKSTQTLVGAALR